MVRVLGQVMPLGGWWGVLVLGLTWSCLVALKALLFLQLYGLAHRMYTRDKLDEQVSAPGHTAHSLESIPFITGKVQCNANLCVCGMRGMQEQTLTAVEREEAETRAGLAGVQRYSLLSGKVP